eukprot:1158944-Pelagomonas_calceolata.AAC.3
MEFSDTHTGSRPRTPRETEHQLQPPAHQLTAPEGAAKGVTWSSATHTQDPGRGHLARQNISCSYQLIDQQLLWNAAPPKSDTEFWAEDLG